MVQPQLVQPLIPVPVEQVGACRVGPGYVRPAAIDEGPEIVDQHDCALAVHHPARALIHRVDPFTGLADADLASIHRWLAEQ